MAAEQANPLAELASAVIEEEQDYDLILEHAEAALKLPAGEHTQEVQLCRLMALVNNSDYAEVLKSLKVSAPSQQPLPSWARVASSHIDVDAASKVID